MTAPRPLPAPPSAGVAQHRSGAPGQTRQAPPTTGPDTAGPDTAGPDTTGPDTTGPAATGPAATGSDTTGPAPAARDARQYGFDVLRVLAICGVVTIHVIGPVTARDELRGTLTWWAATALRLGSSWAVPVFVMISGALVLAPRAHAAGPAAFYRKRFARVLPALVVWHLVYLLGVRLVLQGNGVAGNELARMLIDGKVFTGLYFLWLIAGLYVVAPVLAAFLRDGGQRRALATAGVALGFTVAVYAVAGLAAVLGFPRPIRLGALSLWWPYVGYFVAGWALSRVVLGRRGTALAAGTAVALLAALVLQTGALPRGAWPHYVLPVAYVGPLVAGASVCIFLVAVSLGRRVALPAAPTRILVRLSEATFGVFLVHLLVFEVIRQTVPAVAAFRNLPVMLGAYVVVLVVSFAVSTAAAKVPYLRTVF